jgi:predicted small secreted protein
MKKSIWSALLAVFLLLTLALTACEATISAGQDPPIPHVTRQDRGWVDPTGRISASGDQAKVLKPSDSTQSALKAFYENYPTFGRPGMLQQLGLVPAL